MKYRTNTWDSEGSDGDAWQNVEGGFVWIAVGDGVVMAVDPWKFVNVRLGKKTNFYSIVVHCLVLLKNDRLPSEDIFDCHLINSSTSKNSFFLE